MEKGKLLMTFGTTYVYTAAVFWDTEKAFDTT
jgi:hypothetical protein